MKLKIYQVDAFTDEVFKGNYAAVIITNEPLPEKLMQAIATENNLSETAFACRLKEAHYALRWFSPVTEIDFCGHATLATAFVIFRQSPALQHLVFSSKSVGDLSADRNPNGEIEMSFPNRKPEPIQQIPQALLDGLSKKPKEVLRNQQAYFAIYDRDSDVFQLQSSSHDLAKLAPYDVVVTAPSDSVDFVSRYFWPANGGDEDPVTGSIHAGLAPFWGERLGKTQMTAYQASQRGGLLKCSLDGTRVIIAGKAVLFLEGEIFIENVKH